MLKGKMLTKYLLVMLSLFAIVFTTCMLWDMDDMRQKARGEGVKKPVNPVEPAINGITLYISSEKHVSITQPESLNAGTFYTFWAAVDGTNGRSANGAVKKFNSAYKMEVNATFDGVTRQALVDGMGAQVSIQTGTSGTLQIIATSNSDPTYNIFWSVDIFVEGSSGISFHAPVNNVTPPAVNPRAQQIIIVPGAIVKEIKMFAVEYNNGLHAGTFSKLDTVNVGQSFIFTAKVEVEGEIGNSYEIIVSSSTMVEGSSYYYYNSYDKLITFKNVGTVIITARSVGNNSIYESWRINVTFGFSGGRWEIRNTAYNLDPQTTKNLVAANGRYTIFNNEPYAEIGNSSFQDVTIMYFNKPFRSNPNNWTPFGIEARIRISGYRDKELSGDGVSTWLNSLQAVAMVAIIQNPEYIQNDDYLYFVGPRMTASGSMRSFLRRGNDTGIGSVQFGDANFKDYKGMLASELKKYIGDTSSGDQWYDKTRREKIEKKYGFSDQEFTYRLTRTDEKNYRVSVWASDGTPIIEESDVIGSNLIDEHLIDADQDVYFAFLVYGVKAEISNIKLFHGEEEWEDTAVRGAFAIPDKPRRVDFTHNDNNYNYKKLYGYDNYDYAVAANEFPINGLTLTPQVVPLNLSQDVTLSIVDGESILKLSDNDNTLYIGTGYGAVTVKATPKAGVVVPAPGAIPDSDYSVFKLYIAASADTVAVTDVTINTPSYVLNAGASVNLSASVYPNDAPKYVTWTVWGDVQGTLGTGLASITQTTGVLKANSPGPESDTYVYVIATSNNGADGTPVKSEALMITIKAAGDIFVTIPWEWTFGSKLGSYGFVTHNSDDENTVKKTDASYENGMTITALNIAGAGQTGMRWTPTRNSGSSTWTGCIQPESADRLAEGATFLQIENVQGPFKITLNYTGTGGGQTDRYPQLYINGTKVKNFENTNGTAETTDTYYYEGNDKVLIELGSNNNIRLYEVWLY